MPGAAGAESGCREPGLDAGSGERPDGGTGIPRGDPGGPVRAGVLLFPGHDPVFLCRAHAGCGLERVDEQAAVSGCREPCVGCTVPDRAVLVHLPFVYIIKNGGLAGPTATMYEQIGYSLADVIAKAVFGVLIWAIASEKTCRGGEWKADASLCLVDRGLSVHPGTTVCALVHPASDACARCLAVSFAIKAGSSSALLLCVMLLWATLQL